MKLWQYTDDVVVFLLMGVWAAGKFIPTVTPVEDSYMTMALGYVFGNIVQKMKLQEGIET